MRSDHDPVLLPVGELERDGDALHHAESVVLLLLVGVVSDFSTLQFLDFIAGCYCCRAIGVVFWAARRRGRAGLEADDEVVQVGDPPWGGLKIGAVLVLIVLLLLLLTR